MKVNYNLKDKEKEEELVICSVTYNKQRIRRSTTKKAYTKAWNSEKQRCTISTDFPDRINRKSSQLNKFLDELEKKLNHYYDKDDYLMGVSHVKLLFDSFLDSMIKDEADEEKKKQITPLEFFNTFVSEKRINKASGTYVAERTMGHHITVLKRFKEFFKENNLIDNFSVFNKSFESRFEKWCYDKKHYSANTIPASFSILKVWLKAAAEQGFITSTDYTQYKSKAKNVDNIYLTVDEIKRIYELNISVLMAKGLIDRKSKIEITRDLFIIGCWTGLRISDLNRLNESAIFNLVNNSVSIFTEKTHERVEIPLHPYLVDLYNKYNSNFPKMVAKDKSIEHLKELGRLAGIDTEEIIQINRAGKIETMRCLRYQLIKNHTARRSFATNLYLAGAPTINIMKLTGHTTEANFMKYIKITKEENLEIMRKFF